MPAHRVSRVSKKCQHCRKTFSILPSAAKRGEGRYCSTLCYHWGREQPIADRFWKKVRKTEQCWLWIGARQGSNKWKYGVLNLGRRGHGIMRAHRLSWQIHHGPVPDGMWVLHRCDTPLCIRPDHLFLGTPSDNSLDMLRKGRCLTKLTPEQVKQIRHQYADGGVMYKELAQMYGVSKGLISFIINRQIWKHI